MLKEVANRYKVLATLGEGGMGTVYLVEDTTNGQQVALKVLSGKMGMDENLFLQFKQEFRVMSRLKHPNTCAVYDYGMLPEGAPYFTMEVVPGKGLDEMIPLAPEQFTAISHQLGVALAYIHSQGFVHCDIKPENVRVKPDGTVKLMDFGLMEVAGQSGGAIKGTLAYIAPEVAKRDRIDQRSDIYSLGAVDYQLLTGETPFKGATPIEVLRAHLNQKPRSLRELNPEIPTALEQVILKMLAKEPVARYQSMVDVLAALGIEVDDGMGATLLASAFVGRQSELAQLQEALQSVKRDRLGHTLWLTGAAGTGKSRLLGEFRFHVQLEEIPYLLGACTEQKAPYGPFIEILRGVLPIAKEHCPSALAEAAPLLSKLLPELAGTGPAPALEPEQEKILLQSAIANLILAASAKTGAAMVIEDWDLADPLSSEVLTYLLRNASDSPLLVVISGRACEAGSGTVLELPTLSQPETVAMVTSMLGIESFPAGLADQLFELTAGNAQYVTNLLEHLLRSRSLTKAKGAWQFPEAFSAADLPTDVKGLLLERFSSLSETGLAVAKLAAILGAPFGLKIVRQLLGLADDALFDALEELMQEKLLVLDGRTYAFATVDLKDALYGSIEDAEREKLHTAVAEYLEIEISAKGQPDVNQVTTLARHYMKSSHRDKAIHIALKAAVRNRELFNTAVTVELLESGWKLLEPHSANAEWDLTRGQYLHNLAAGHILLHALDAAKTSLDVGLPLAERLGDKQLLLDMLMTAAHQRMSTYASDNLKEAVETYAKAADLAAEMGETKMRIRATANRARSLFFLGQNAQAQEVFEEATTLAKGAEEYWYARSLAFLGYLQATSGAHEEGLANMAEAVATQERISDKYGVGYSLMLLTTAQMHAGRLKEAVESAIRQAEICKELGTMDDYTVAILNQSMAYGDMGDFDNAIAAGTACFKEATARNHKMALPISQATLALASLYKGDLKGAEASIRAAEARAKETNNYVYSLVIPSVIEAWLQLGRLQDALAAAQEARDLITSTGNTDIETRLWVLMGEIHGRLGENPAARSYFDRAADRASKGHEDHILARASKGLAWMDLNENKLELAEAHLSKALELSKAIPLRHVEAECHVLFGQLHGAKKNSEAALASFDAAIGAAASLGTPDLHAIALHGRAKVTDDRAHAKELITQAKTRLAILLEQVEGESRDAFLSFMERAQLARDGEAKPAAGGAPAIVAAAPEPELGEEATVTERAEWLTRQIASASATQSAEASRLAAIANEFEKLQASGGTGADSARVAELERSNRRMEQLMKFSLAVNNVTNLENLLEQAVDLIVEITDAERGFLLFFEDGQIRSQVSRVNTDRRSPMDWQFSKSIAEKVLKTGEVVCVFDALSDTQFNQAQSVVDLNLRTVICVPMRMRGVMVGAIYVDRQSINENFTPDDLEMVMSLAAQAAGAIQNARIHQEWIDKSKRLEMLNGLSKTISGSLDLEEVLDLIVKMTLEVSRAERGFLFLLNDDRRKLICRAARDTRGSLPVDQDHEVSQSICAKVLQTGEAENVADALNDEEFQFQQSIMALNLRMVMCVPIYAKGVVIGLLYVDSQAVVNAFGDKDLDLLKNIAGHASVSIENAKLHAQTVKLAEDRTKMFYSFVTALGASIDAKHPLTSGHSSRVTEYSVRLAKRIGLPAEEVENIRIAGLLHDVGKIGTPDHILMKPGSFTPEEYEIMKQHVVHTKEILDTIHFPENQRHIPAVAGAHHEKWDGTGYPNKQAGEDIPFGGRIMALGDVFDAITSKRDYREAMPLQKALDIIRNGIGTHFDPTLAPEFIKMIEEEGVTVFEQQERRVEAEASPVPTS